MNNHDGPTGKYFTHDGVQYYIRPDVLCGANTRKIRAAIEDRNMIRVNALVAMAGKPGANARGFYQMAEALLGVPSNDQIFDSIEDENILPLILSLCVEPELRIDQAQKVVNEFPHFPLLSKQVLAASGIIEAAKNLNRLGEKPGHQFNDSDQPSSSTETYLEPTPVGPSKTSIDLATTNSG